MIEIHRQTTRLVTTVNFNIEVSTNKSKIRSLQDTFNSLLRTFKRFYEKQRLDF